MDKDVILAGVDVKKLNGFGRHGRIALPGAFRTDRFPHQAGPGRKFTAAIATSFVGQPGYLGWRDLQRMIKGRVRIASAGHYHLNLLFRDALLPASAYKENVKQEIALSKEVLERKLGVTVDGFVYPFGFYDEGIKRMVKRAGYSWALSSVQGVNTRDTDPYELKRIDIEFDDTRASVSRKIGGRHRVRLTRHPLTSVIIPTYNRKRLLEPVLKSLMDQRYPADRYEVIVVDDGGSDGSDALVREMALDAKTALRYLRQEDKGYRPGTARNLGARHAKGDILLFLDGDVVAHPDLLLQHARFHARWPDRIILGYVCAHTCLNTYDVPGVIRAVEDKMLDDLPLLPELRDSTYSRCLDDLDSYHSYWTTFFSNNVSLAKWIFDEAGGFDDSFRGWGIEDNELGYRLARAGYKFTVSRKAVGFHIGTEGEFLNPMLSPDERKFKLLATNMKRFYEKHPHKEVRLFLGGLDANLPGEFRLFKGSPEDSPEEQAVVILGGECNNSCTLCSLLGKKAPHRLTGEVKYELDSLRNKKRVWLAGGEPTLREDFFDIIGYARHAGFREIGIRTNGRAFAYQDFAERALKWGATHFDIQLHGSSVEAHDAITRMPGSFKQAVRGISNLKGCGAVVSLEFVVPSTEDMGMVGRMRLARALRADSIKTTEVAGMRAMDGHG